MFRAAEIARAGTTSLRFSPRGEKSELESYVNGPGSFGSVTYLELYFRSFVQCPEALRLNRGMVDEYVTTAFTLDKPETLVGIKPLHSTFFSHY